MRLPFPLGWMRDEYCERRGLYWGDGSSHRGRFLDVRALAFHCEARGGDAYVMWGRPELWRRNDLLKPGADIVIDAKSGISGAGKAATERTHFSENHGSVAAYKPFGHRHAPEMEQALGQAVTFVPHLVPLDRGILASLYAHLTPGTTAAAVADAFQRAYADAPFVRVTGEELPEIKHVAHTNFCDVGWKVDERSGRVFIVSVIDNLVKGAAGQAIQNFNVMYGCDQTEGLL